MSIIKEYIEYLKDNPEDYWFKRKLYGWGWVPARWQGWLVVALGLLIAGAGIYVGEIDDAPGASALGILLMIGLFFYFGYKKGEKPKWQWGLNEENKKEILVKNSDEGRVVTIFLPGISGGAFTDRFSLFYEECNKNNIDILKAQYWESLEDLEKKSITEIFDEINNAVSSLIQKGYEEIFAVGKSFGGAMLLLRNHPKISKMVLWAPPVGVDKKRSNLKEVKTVSFSKIDSLLDVKVSTNYLSKINTPIKIINGEKDEISPFENAVKIAKNLKEGVLKEIPKAGHSYETITIQRKVAKETINFLK